MVKNKGLAFLRKNRYWGYKIKYAYFLLRKKNRLQRKQRYGEYNPDKVIYVVKPDSEDGIEGLLSLVARASLYIRFAKSKGYFPVVDWKNYKTQYYDGRTNAWEYYFKQPTNITLDESYRSKNVILSGWTFKDINPNEIFNCKQFFDAKLNLECYETLTDTIKFSDEVNKSVRHEADSLNISQCLGVYVRGTDYVKLKPSGEYVQPTVKQVIEKVDEFLSTHKDLPIFLVTEDGNIYEVLKRRYGDRIHIVSFDSFIYEYTGKDFLSKSNVFKYDGKLRGQHYLIKMILLSKCRYLISSITMGSMFSFGLNGNKYEEKYIFNLGLYP